MIEVILPIYKRKYRLKEIIDQLKAQTIQNFNLNIWNNTGEKLEVDFPKERLQIVNSEKNLSGGDRWKLVPMTKGNPIISIDDDMWLLPSFLENYLEEFEFFGEGFLFGWYTKRWERGETDYSKDKEFILPRHKNVDYIGSGGMMGDRRFFMRPEVIENKEFYDHYRSEDIFISYFARQMGLRLISVEGRCNLVDDAFNSSTKDKPLKKEAFRLLIKRGWKFL